MNRKLAWGVIGGLLLVASGAVCLQARPIARRSIQTNMPIAMQVATTPTVGAATATPALITVNTPTTVTVTVQITDSRLLPNGVNLLRLNSNGSSTILGVMHDDGLNGDATGNDKTLSLNVNFDEAATGQVQLQISAAFKGQLKRTISPVSFIEVGNGFQDTSLSLSITLPQGWTPTAVSSDSLGSAIGFVPPTAPHPEYGGDVTIFKWNNPQNLSLTDFFDGSHGPEDVFSDTTGSIDAININGHAGTHFGQVVGISTREIYVFPGAGFFIEYQVSGSFDESSKILQSLTF
jgi:hypothetical protein